MAQQQDDVCLVCADPLEFTAFGSCGHKDVCSRCVARMRFVLKDTGCVFCRQESPQVYFTRFMGDYTARLGPEDYANLQARANRRELFVMPEISGYFDDERHYQEIRALCGFTHPIISSEKITLNFNNYNALKRHIESTYNQFFCDVCVKGRKIFLSEQLLYSKDNLRRHQDTGDESGPLAESGFKGHPPCKFCRTRFYDSNDLYRHMEGSHERCHLCKRAAPDTYVYYRHYQELEEHFTKDHHPCPHPNCLERKFVVFSTDYELKAHFAAEHGDEMKMSGAQRRQALTIPLQLQYRSRDDEETEPGPSARLERAAVVIGGGHNIGSRAARSGRGGGAGGSSGMHHSRSESQIAQEAAPEVSSITFTAEDFPAPSSSQQSGAGPLGRWAAFTGAQAAAGGLSDQDFPALPTMSKNQRRRLKEQQRTLADRLAAAAQPPRVINRATNSASASTSGGASTLGAGGSSVQAPPVATDFPVLASSAPPTVASPATMVSLTVSSTGSRSADMVAPPSQTKRPPGFGHAEFPVLGGGGGGKQRTPLSSPVPAPTVAYSGAAAGQSSGSGQAPLSQASILNSLFMRPGSAAATTLGRDAGQASTSAGAILGATPELNAEDFPSLPGGGKKAGKAKIVLRAQPVQKSPAKPVSSAAAGASAKTSASAAPSSSTSGGGTGGVSDSLKAANKALIERIKRQLSGAAFDTFRQQSLLFMRGDLQADEYHDYMVSLGLLSGVAELVSLCPDPSKRRLLLEVHRAFISSPAAQDPGLVGAGWMPPEAAVAKADRVAQHSAWGCPQCSLCNAPDDARCESCGAARPSEEEQVAAAMATAVSLRPAPLFSIVGASAGYVPTPANTGPPPSRDQPEQPRPPPRPEDFPSLVPSSASRGGAFSRTSGINSGNDLARMDSIGTDEGGALGSGAGSGGKGKKNKGTTIKIGLPTSGTGSAGNRSHPQNVWTQPAFKSKVANQWSGQGGGKLAKMHGAINDAWE